MEDEIQTKKHVLSKYSAFIDRGHPVVLYNVHKVIYSSTTAIYSQQYTVWLHVSVLANYLQGST